jgi:galactose mutarotase-like enzyme
MIYPIDAAAQTGLDDWPQYSGAVADYQSPVFLHHVKHDSDHRSKVAVINEDWGLSVRWDTRQMPYFTQWKNLRQGVYVSGIEPGNCVPEGQNTARKNNRLQILEPNETRVFGCQISIVDGAEAVQNSVAAIQDLQHTGVAVSDVQLDDYRKFLH